MTWPLGYTTLSGLVAGTGTFALGVSRDGTVVVGEADDSDFNPHAVYWTIDSGPIDLGLLSGGTFAYATATNLDGSVIVGVADGADGFDRAFIWTSGGGMISLGLPDGSTQARALGVSADGTIVVGFCNPAPDGGDRPFRWTQAGGFVFLPTRTPSDGTITAAAEAISADGVVVVGEGDAPFSPQHPVRWPNSTTIVDLDPSATEQSIAFAASSDGSVVVGTLAAFTSPRAFRWTSGGGAVSLGLLPDGVSSFGAGVTADGSTVIGTATNSSDQIVCYVWTEADGMVALPPLTGVALTDGYDAGGISANGQAVVGDAPITGSPVGGNGQNPAHYVATGDGLTETPQLGSPLETVFGSQLTTGICSFWVHVGSTFEPYVFNVTITESAIDPAHYYELGFGIDNFAQFDLDVISQNSPGTDIQFQGGGNITWPTDCAVNVLCSFDFTLATQRLQLYVNDVAVSTVVGASHGNPPPTFGSQTKILTGFGNGVDIRQGYIADLWVGSTASFVDLTVAANRRKFINADLSPASLGSTGQTPFGTAPQLYQTMANSSDPISAWLTNRGTAGGIFAVTSGDVRNNGDPCVSIPILQTAFVYGRGVTPPPPLAMSDFICTERVSAEPELSLRWSDSRGASWSSWIRKAFTTTGQYDIDIAFYRLGLARDRIWELSWATPSATALTGAFISFEIAGS